MPPRFCAAIRCKHEPGLRAVFHDTQRTTRHRIPEGARDARYAQTDFGVGAPCPRDLESLKNFSPARCFTELPECSMSQPMVARI